MDIEEQEAREQFRQNFYHNLKHQTIENEEIVSAKTMINAEWMDRREFRNPNGQRATMAHEIMDRDPIILEYLYPRTGIAAYGFQISYNKQTLRYHFFGYDYDGIRIIDGYEHSRDCEEFQQWFKRKKRVNSILKTDMSIF